ncbi:MAG: hypothetical protein KDI29_17150, partial [Pseudomonadales bacterium]|nr:hypothetical protein [Pseudomonadales bacterium]
RRVFASHLVRRTTRSDAPTRYQRHQPETTLLFRIVEQLYTAFLAHLEAEGRNLPDLRSTKTQPMTKSANHISRPQTDGDKIPRSITLAPWMRLHLFLESIFHVPLFPSFSFCQSCLRCRFFRCLPADPGVGRSGPARCHCFVSERNHVRSRGVGRYGNGIRQNLRR